MNTAVEPQRPAPVAVAPAASHKASGKLPEQLSRRLQWQIKDALGFVEDIDPDLPLNEIGLDSLLSVSLSNSLERAFGIPVPVAQLISGPTINQLLAGLFAEWEESVSPEQTEPVAPAAPLAGGVPIVWLPLKSRPASQIQPQALRAPAVRPCAAPAQRAMRPRRRCCVKRAGRSKTSKTANIRSRECRMKKVKALSIMSCGETTVCPSPWLKRTVPGSERCQAG